MTNSSSAAFPSVPILGVRVDRIDMQTTMDVILRFSKSDHPHQIITLDSSMCVMAQKDDELRRIINNADLITPDSAGILWACKKLGKPLEERVSGVEIVERLVQESTRSDLRLYFLGASPGVAEMAKTKLELAYPGCKIVGCRDGFFSEFSEQSVVEEVAATGANIVCIALGIPKQEKFIAQWGEQMKASVCIGVGGTFDVLSGNVQRAPMWMRRHSMEWLYRLWRNPRKYAKVLTLPKFVWMILFANADVQPAAQSLKP